MTCAHLFVYGTLMSAAMGPMGAGERARLARSGRTAGPATVAGRLVDLGRYPGLIDAAAPGDLVVGEVIQLEDAAEVFGWLDRYEGLDAPDAEYERVIRSARLASGASVEAWLYRYRRDASGLPAVAGGLWRG